VSARCRAALSIGCIAAVVVLTATPASAHATAGQAPSNWVSVVVRIAPATAGIIASTTDLGEHVELDNASSRVVTVSGYRGEPYLRIGRDGVFENLRSPAAFLNRSTTLPNHVPSAYDATAPPRWVLVSRGTSWRWHDHRAHAMSGTHVPDNGDAIRWTIPLRIGNQPAAIQGRLAYRAAGLPVGAVVALLVGFAAVAMTALRRFVVPPLAALCITAGVLAVLQLVGELRFGTTSVAARLGPFTYDASAALAAFVLAWVVWRYREAARTAPALLFGGIVIAVAAGFAHVDWLTHSYLPSAWSRGAAQNIVGFEIGAGVALAVAGIHHLRRSTAAASMRR
jgi:hypothetical protein